MWSGPETGVQGVTELQICERTDDLWLQSVQEEFRYGNLQRDTHAFLHGKPTLRPGSILNGKVQCKRDWCRERAREMMELEKTTSLTESVRAQHAEETKERECGYCKREKN